MVVFTYLYIDMIFAFYRYVDSFSVFTPLYFIVGWLYEHDCLECLMCICFIFWYLYLFSAIEHVPQGKVL